MLLKELLQDTELYTEISILQRTEMVTGGFTHTNRWLVKAIMVTTVDRNKLTNTVYDNKEVALIGVDGDTLIVTLKEDN